MALRSHFCRLLASISCKRAQNEKKCFLGLWQRSKSFLCGMSTSSVIMTSGGILGHVPWLTNSAPAFGVSGNNIEVIHEPHEFYETLKEEASKAKHRIVLSSLYIGTGSLEKDLINVIHHSLQENTNLEVQILLDYTRGSRGEHNSRTLLLPLLKEFPTRVSVALYHTPDLRGFWKAVTPDRYNETIGVQHMKIYMFDNNLVMSGANLSDSYFTNRQDRYTLLRNCVHLCDFFHDLVATMSAVSFQLSPDNTVHLLPDLDSHPYNDADGGRKYREEVRQRVESVMDQQWYEDFSSFPERKPQAAGSPLSSNSPTNKHERQRTMPVWKSSEDCDTWVFPLIQMGPFNIRQDETITTDLLCQLPQGSVVNLASGYFNLTHHYMETIVHNSKASYKILTASPQANGFFGASGISGYVPCAYTYIAKGFYQQVLSAKEQDRIHLSEFSRPGWTFHAKGLWCYFPGQHWPSLTLIGSPNFGFRSVYRDIEAQIAIVTENEHLQKQLFQEQEALFQRAEEVTQETFDKPDRQVPLWATLLTKYFIRHFF